PTRVPGGARRGLARGPGRGRGGGGARAGRGTASVPGLARGGLEPRAGRRGRGLRAGARRRRHDPGEPLAVTTAAPRGGARVDCAEGPPSSFRAAEGSWAQSLTGGAR